MTVILRMVALPWVDILQSSPLLDAPKKVTHMDLLPYYTAGFL